MIFVYEFTSAPPGHGASIALIGSIDSCISYTYEKCFADAGEFSMNFPYSQETFNLLSRRANKNHIIRIDDFYGIVYKVTIKKQVESKRIVIKGKQLSSLLTNYNRFDALGVSGVINGYFDEDLDTRFSHAHSVFDSESAYHLPKFITFDISKYTSVHSSLELDECLTKGHNWFEYIQTGCNLLNIGFDLVVNSDGALEVVLLFSRTRPGVVFHSQIQDFLTSEYNTNSQNMYTLCKVDIHNITYTDSGGTEHHIASDQARQSDVSSSENVGAVLRAYIMDVDGSNLSYSSESAFKKYARGLARSFLASHNLVNSYAADIDLSRVKYTLGQDYSVGDNLTLIDTDIAVSVQAKLTSYTKSLDSNGKIKIKPCFGYDQATLSKVLSRNQII